MGLINVFDENMRKVVVACVAIIAIVVLSFSNLSAEMYGKVIDVILYLVGLFITGNALEHLKGLILDMKKAKIEGQITIAQTKPPTP
jgi:asparagine N-glycosylation enzyme membrane subunit Stt3